MKTTKYKNSTIRFHGEVDYKRVEEAAIIFLKKVNKYRKNKSKGIIQGGHDKRWNNRRIGFYSTFSR